MSNSKVVILLEIALLLGITALFAVVAYITAFMDWVDGRVTLAASVYLGGTYGLFSLWWLLVRIGMLNDYSRKIPILVWGGLIFGIGFVIYVFTSAPNHLSFLACVIPLAIAIHLLQLKFSAPKT